MQTWITDKNFYKSAFNLDSKRLHAQIYEGINILASLLKCNDKLVNPKRDVSNHPAAKFWKGDEYGLFSYIMKHYIIWFLKWSKKETEYKETINYKNTGIIEKYLNPNIHRYKDASWITDELIQTHRSVLIKKEIEKEYKLKYEAKCIQYNEDLTHFQIQEERNRLYDKITYHYRNLWPDVPSDLKMRYDWRLI